MPYVWMKIKRGRPQKFITVSRHAWDVSWKNASIQKKRSKKESYKHRLFSGSLLVPSSRWSYAKNTKEKLCWIYLVWCYYSFLALCVFHKHTSTFVPRFSHSFPDAVLSQYYRRILGRNFSYAANEYICTRLLALATTECSSLRWGWKKNKDLIENVDIIYCFNLFSMFLMIKYKYFI